MSKEDLHKEISKGSEKLKHVDTKSSKAEMALKLKCQACSKTMAFPVHCDVQLEVESDTKLKCSVCGQSSDIPKHCNKPMKPFISKA